MCGRLQDQQDAGKPESDSAPAPGAHPLPEERARQGGGEQGGGEADGDRVGQGDQLQRIVECQHSDDVEAGAQHMAGEAPCPERCQAAGSMGNARGDEDADDIA